MININNRTKRRRVGDIGENIACDFLVNRGFEIIERNYLRRWGEIDIVARKDGVLRFVEVKSLSVPHVTSLPNQEEALIGVAHGTKQIHKESEGTFRPEENMHPGKLKRLTRIIQTYMLHRKLDCDFQLDLVTVRIDEEARQAKVELVENIIT
jgi:putative endonuclease